MPVDGRPSPPNSLDDITRRRAFVAAAMVVLVATVGIALLPEGKQATAQREQPASQRVTTSPGVTPPTATTPVTTTADQQSTPPVRRGPTPMRDLDAGDRDVIVARARAFLRPYLRYEIGDVNDNVRRNLRHNATRAFTRELLDHPPEPPQGTHPSPGRVLSVELGDDPNAPVIGVFATISRSGRLSPLSMHFHREQDRWRVSQVL